MTLAALLALAAVGCGVGFLAGLVGVGGGVLMVPFLYLFYGHAGWSGVSMPDSLHTTVAHATSLFVIIPTAIAGTVTYARAGLVTWRAAVPIAAFSVLAAAAGAVIATGLPQALLRIGFGAFLLFTALQLTRRRHAPDADGLRLHWPLVALTGTLVGLLSAMLGVGGGLVAIPLMLQVMRMGIERVAATSLAIVVVAATAGTLTYAIAGAGVAGLPAGSLGYVHVAAGLPMVPGAMLFVRYGARLNQRMDPTRLRYLFAAIFAVLGIRLLLSNAGALIQP
jgi:uncharacterized protein